MMPGDVREKLFAAARRALPGQPDAASGIVAACAPIYTLRGVEAAIEQKVQDELQALGAFEPHLRYAAKAEDHLARITAVRGVRLPKSSVLRARHAEVAAALAPMKRRGGRPAKREPTWFALAINGALERSAVPQKARRSILRECLAALEFPPDEVDSALKKLPALLRGMRN